MSSEFVASTMVACGFSSGEIASISGSFTISGVVFSSFISATGFAPDVFLTAGPLVAPALLFFFAAAFFFGVDFLAVFFFAPAFFFAAVFFVVVFLGAAFFFEVDFSKLFFPMLTSLKNINNNEAPLLTEK